MEAHDMNITTADARAKPPAGFDEYARKAEFPLPSAGKVREWVTLTRRK
jgi:hypothetical protein